MKPTLLEVLKSFIFLPVISIKKKIFRYNLSFKNKFYLYCINLPFLVAKMVPLDETYCMYINKICYKILLRLNYCLFFHTKNERTAVFLFIIIRYVISYILKDIFFFVLFSKQFIIFYWHFIKHSHYKKLLLKFIITLDTLQTKNIKA